MINQTNMYVTGVERGAKPAQVLDQRFRFSYLELNGHMPGAVVGCRNLVGTSCSCVRLASITCFLGRALNVVIPYNQSLSIYLFLSEPSQCTNIYTHTDW